MAATDMNFSGLFKTDLGGVGLYARVTDANAPERIPDDGWKGSRFLVGEYDYHIGKEDIVVSLLSQHLTLAQAFVMLRAFFSGPSDTLPTDPTAGNTIDLKVDLNLGTQDLYYENCWVNTLTVRGEANGAISMELELFPATRTEGTQTATALVVATPLLMSDVAFSIASTTYKPAAFELVLTQGLESQFDNSINRHAVGAGMFGVSGSLNLNVNETTWAALFAEGLDDDNTLADLIITITLSTQSAILTVPLIGIPGGIPAMPDSGMWKGDLNFVGYTPAAGDIVTCVIDDTP